MKQIALLGNSREVLQGYPDDYFDLAILDPPQGNGTASILAKKSGKTQGLGYGIPRGTYRKSEWDLALRQEG